MNDDFMWQAISHQIAGQATSSRTGFTNIKCPICNDYKRRCGIRQGNPITVTCFNCHFKTGWSLGSSIGPKFKSFLAGIGVTDTEISKLNYKAFSYRATIQNSTNANLLLKTHSAPTFDTMQLPPGSKSFKELDAAGVVDPDYLAAKAYIAGRGAELAAAYDYYWSPSDKYEMSRRVIVPMFHEGRLVGYSARAIDPGNKQRYHMKAPPNFLFNSSALTQPNRKYVILVEGILDAIAIDGVGLLGAHLNEEQIAWIKSANKIPIMLVDRDRRGQDLVDVAIANDWHVSFAAGGINGWWDASIKDAADAVAAYGSLWTVMSVISEATNNKIKINYQRKKLIGK